MASPSHPRWLAPVALAGLTALAFGLRWGWMARGGAWHAALDPTAPRSVRRLFDGHEYHYFQAFLGNPPDPGTHAWPAVTTWLQGLGTLSQDPRLLLAVSCLAGALAVAGIAKWTARAAGPWAGAWAGLLACVWGEHMAWSTSAYPVILPHALLVWAFVVRRQGVAAVLIAAAASMRPELALFGLLRGWPGVFGAAVGAAWLWAMAGPTPSDPWTALRVNLPLIGFLGPPVLWLGLAGLPHRRGPVLALAALLVHLSSALFDDYGARHGLMGGAALCALAGIAAARWGGGLAILIGAIMVFDAADIAAAWQTRTPPEAAALDLPARPGHCVEVSEEPPIEGQPMPSHFAWFTGTLDGDCVVWGEESAHRRWSSRGLRDRAIRMRHLYPMTPIAKEDPGNGRPVRVVHRLGAPR